MAQKELTSSMKVWTAWCGCGTIQGGSIDFPFLRDNVILVAHNELYRPYSKSEEDVHPPPPDLRGVIQHYGQTDQISTTNGRQMGHSLSRCE